MLFGGYIILSLSNTYIQEFSYGKHRVARMLKKVNKQFYHKYNYFLLVSTVIICSKYIIICSFMSVYVIISIYDCLLSTVNHSLSNIYV